MSDDAAVWEIALGLTRLGARDRSADQDRLAAVIAAKADVSEQEARARLQQWQGEAAAATAVVLEKLMARPIPTFIADHPFAFLIRERSTATILFMGRLVDPNA